MYVTHIFVQVHDTDTNVEVGHVRVYEGVRTRVERF